MPTAPFPLSGLADEAADDIAGQIAAHQALGWSALELRLLNGKQFSGPAVSDDEFKRAVDKIEAAGMRVSSYASAIGHATLPLKDLLAGRIPGTGFRPFHVQQSLLARGDAMTAVRALAEERRLVEGEEAEAHGGAGYFLSQGRLSRSTLPPVRMRPARRPATGIFPSRMAA